MAKSKIVQEKPAKRERVRTPVGTRSRTKQSFMDQTDINLIMKKFGRTGVLEHTTHKEPQYGDFTMSVDLQEAIELVKTAQEKFMGLPAEVRFAAGNSPVQYSEMLASEEGAMMLQEAGLPLGLAMPEDVDPGARATEGSAGAEQGGNEGGGD